MEDAPEPPSSSSSASPWDRSRKWLKENNYKNKHVHSNSAGEIESSEGELIKIGHKKIFSSSSISLSEDDFKSLNVDDEEDSETGSSRASTPEFDSLGNPKWRGFFHMLKKGPAVGLHTFHPPSLPSIKKLAKKKSRNSRQSLPSLDANLDPELCCFRSSWRNFTLQELEDATGDFSPDNLIGEGGYSEVYKGHLQDGQLVAIKRLIRGTSEEMTADFLSELGILVHVNHPNIANVIGYGVEGGMHLILHLSPHGSLSSVLTDGKENLGWSVRYKIAIGAAKGLWYLHEGCQRRIIHRDIKAANVLLREDFEPQISDFGLAKWLPEQWTHLTVSQIEGTFGYLPPEFFMHGLVDEKTDVYAYGVLVLELITGRLALDKSQQSLLMWAKPLLAKNDIQELADPSLGGVYDVEQLNRMILVATMCIQVSASERPPMSKVIRLLKGEEDLAERAKKLQKRPLIKRTFSLESNTNAEENNSNSAAMHLNEMNQQMKVSLEL